MVKIGTKKKIGKSTFVYVGKSYSPSGWMNTRFSYTKKVVKALKLRR